MLEENIASILHTSILPVIRTPCTRCSFDIFFSWLYQSIFCNIYYKFIVVEYLICTKVYEHFIYKEICWHLIVSFKNNTSCVIIIPIISRSWFHDIWLIKCNDLFTLHLLIFTHFFSYFSAFHVTSYHITHFSFSFSPFIFIKGGEQNDVCIN